MKSIQKALLILVIALTCGAFSSSAQVFVSVRPERPHYTRVAAPSPRHVWIDEEWEPRGGSYAFVGGHWAEPPHPHAVWVSGHWAQRPRGWVWTRGHWR